MYIVCTKGLFTVHRGAIGLLPVIEPSLLLSIQAVAPLCKPCM